MDYIYIISNDLGYIKVGISKYPKKRLKQLQTGNQNILSLLFTEEFECKRSHLLKIERELHRNLRCMTKSAKGEWFLITEDQLKSIKNTIIWHRIRYESDPMAFNPYFKKSLC